jgi:hypothetical protein
LWNEKGGMPNIAEPASGALTMADLLDLQKKLCEIALIECKQKTAAWKKELLLGDLTPNLVKLVAAVKRAKLKELREWNDNAITGVVVSKNVLMMDYSKACHTLALVILCLGKLLDGFKDLHHFSPYVASIIKRNPREIMTTVAVIFGVDGSPKGPVWHEDNTVVTTVVSLVGLAEISTVIDGEVLDPLKKYPAVQHTALGANRPRPAMSMNVPQEVEVAGGVWALVVTGNFPCAIDSNTSTLNQCFETVRVTLIMTTHRMDDAEKVNGWACLGQHDYLDQFMGDFNSREESLAALWLSVLEARIILPMVQEPFDVRIPHTTQRMHMHTHSTHTHAHTHTHKHTHTHTH